MNGSGRARITNHHEHIPDMVWVYLTRAETPPAQRATVWNKEGTKRAVMVRDLPHRLVNVTRPVYDALLAKAGRRTPVWKTVKGKRYPALPPVQPGSAEAERNRRNLKITITELSKKVKAVKKETTDHSFANLEPGGVDPNKKFSHGEKTIALSKKITALKNEIRKVARNVQIYGGEKTTQLTREVKKLERGLSSAHADLEFADDKEVSDAAFRVNTRNFD